MCINSQINGSSEYIKRWIQKQPNVKEESLTDWLLYNLSDNVPGIYYIAFSRVEEARTTGADWEWWFIFNEKSFKFRVQAKKGDSTGDNYPAIAYTNKYGLQIEKLIEDARNHNCIPFYAFYTDSTPPNICRQYYGDDGVFISGANILYQDFIQVPRVQVNISQVLSRSIPLSCFFCYELIDGSVNKFIDFLEHNYAKDFIKDDEAAKAIDKYYGVYFEIPYYVKVLLNDNADNVSSWFKQEFRRDIGDINSILVFDLRR